MNTPVSFELAKLLKEKGISIDGKERILHSNYTVYENEYPDCTIAEVVMWVYEKYEVWILVQPISVVGKFQFRTYYNNKGVMNQHWNDSMGKQFNSPTEAYEAAIEYTLNNLI